VQRWVVVRQPFQHFGLWNFRVFHATPFRFAIILCQTPRWPGC
jgi:hypothetical protein